MADRSIFLIIFLTLTCYLNLSRPCYSETDTLQQDQELKDWDYLISSNKVFTLKFFSFGTSISPYLGIFYNPRRSKISGGYHNLYNKNPRTIRCVGCDDDMYDLKDRAVWVANRNNPVTDMYGKLMIDVHGKLSILSGKGTVVNLFSPTSLVTCYASVKLLDNGNFVLQELYPDGSVKRVLWQSFDYPTDTLLPGMKLGINLKTGHRWSLTSWRSRELPADGSFRLTADPNGTGQMVILRRGNIHWLSGSWKNGGFENTNLQYSCVCSDVRLYYISNETEQSFTYLTETYDSSPALTMHLGGQLKSAALFFYIRCSSTRDAGCAEYEFEELNCRKGYYFERSFGHVYGDEYEYDASYNLTSYDCQRICWRNCSCIAYTYGTTNRSQCKTYGKRIYNPTNAENYRPRVYYTIAYEGERKKWIWIIIGMGSLASILSCYLVYKKLHIRGVSKKIQKLLLHPLRRFHNRVRTDKKMNTDLHYFTFQSISYTTNNFSSNNKLGEGGFGAVYKGNLVDGQVVAVKRLSTSSAQGVKEF